MWPPCILSNTVKVHHQSGNADFIRLASRIKNFSSIGTAGYIDEDAIQNLKNRTMKLSQNIYLLIYPFTKCFQAMRGTDLAADTSPPKKNLTMRETATPMPNERLIKRS